MRTHRAAAIGLAFLTVLLIAGGLTLAIANGVFDEDPVSNLVFPFAMTTYAIVGSMIALRRPDHRTGWLLLAIGLGLSLITFTDGYSTRALVTEPGSLPVGTWAAWLNPIAGFAFAVPALALFFLTFPTGAAMSRPWRVVARSVVVIAAACAVSLVLVPLPPEAGFSSPTAISALAPMAGAADAARGIGLLAIVLPSLVSIFVRYRRSAGVERLQMRWLAFVGCTSVVLLVSAIVAGALGAHRVGDPLGVAFLLCLATGVPIAAGIALLRHRLHDIDAVVSTTIVYSGLAAFITVVYVAVVVGVGSIFGRGDEPSIGLSVLATSVAAIAFQPARERLRRVADRFVYGVRATPYEVLSTFADKIAGTPMLDDVLPSMAEMIADGTGGSATIWLKLGETLVPSASCPPQERQRHAMYIGEGVELPAASLTVPVLHDGELLGAVSIDKPRGTPVTPQENRLVEDVAAQAGLVLRNVGLIEELKASRQRLVTAHDEERRRLERDLHDGAQQRLVTMSLVLGLARERAVANADPVLAEQIGDAAAELSLSLAELRELARGIHPAVLREGGLAAALASLADRSTVPAEVRSVPETRFPPDLEGAAYFVVSEALANAAKHAQASGAVIVVRHEGQRLVVEVSDDGVGGASLRGSGLRGLMDRVAAVGGELSIDSPSGRGTTIIAEMPCE